MKVKVISLPYIFQVLYLLCFTRPRYQVSVYRTIGPLVLLFQVFLEFAKRQLEEGQTEKEVELGRQLSRAISVEGKHERDTGSYRL